MIELNNYLFLGDEEVLKKKKIDAIKAQFLDKHLKDIDFEIIYSDDKNLSPPVFNETLSYFPANLSKKRIVFIKDIESLSKDNRNILLRYLKNPSKLVVLLLDSSKLSPSDQFVKELSHFVQRIDLKKTKILDVFDLADAITQQKTQQALSILKTLLDSRQKSYNILGGLFWQWENIKDRLSLDKFKQGLKLLLNTDLRIKTGRLDEELALEMLVIRLSSLV